MNDVTLPGLIVPVEARIDKLERALKKASQAQSRAARQMEDRAKRSADRMAKSYESFGSKAAGALSKLPLPGLGVGLAGLAGAGIGAGLGIAAGQVRETVKGIAEIGNEARRAGVAVEDFQRLSYVASQNRVSVDALTDGLKELNLRADEFVLTAKGSGADAFQRLGYSAAELSKKLKDPSKLFLEIVGRLEKFDRAAQIRIADEVFGGTGGERFVEMLGRGQASISAMMSKASVLTEEQIAKADALDRSYNALTESIHRGWQRAALGAADFAAQILNLRLEGDKLAASDLFRNSAQAPQILGPNVTAALDGNSQAVEENAQAIGDLLVIYERFIAKSDALAPYLQRLSNELANMGETQAADTLFETAGAMQRLSEKLDAGEISAGDFESAMADLIRKAQDALSAVTDLDASPTFSKVIGRLGDLWDALEGVRAKAAEARASLPGGSLPMTSGQGLTVADIEMPPGEFAPTSSPRPKATPPMISENVATPKKGGGGRSHDNYARALADMQNERAALDAEAVALIAAAAAGKSYGDAVEFARKKAELLSAAQRDGKSVTPELSAEIDRLAQSYVEAGNRAEQAADKLKKVEERGQAGASALADLFGSVLDGSASAEEALSGLLMQIAKAQLNQLFGGAASGGFMTWLGGLLGFSAGGYTGDGHKFEPAGVVHKGEYVLSKTATERLGVDNLDALHSAALKGYSSGGLVGAAVPSKALASGSQSASGVSVSYAPTITVEGVGGSPEMNRDLADKIAKATERSFRSVVQDEMRKQMRPGNMLNSRSVAR